jgi:hypothetical protein
MGMVRVILKLLFKKQATGAYRMERKELLMMLMMMMMMMMMVVGLRCVIFMDMAQDRFA